ncbi:unnamed protein product [Phytophthora lilii]|uniref:Unnamed protein product n=1 Tax=Phytophthora lilii TaxID=2077276 RepID=A0A9W6U081_9STRA|nr:unnamed protein product [Phytophthora lilii]
MVFKELAVSSNIPESKLKRAFKNGTLSLTKEELAGTGATLHLHPESYAKAVKARKANKGTRLTITHKEIGYPFKHMNGGGMHGGSIWGKIWGGIKKAFKFAKDSGILTKAADVGIPALATALGSPQGAIPARAALKSMTGIGVESASDTEGGRITMAEIKQGAKQALRYAKQKSIITDLVDLGERKLIEKATKPEHVEMIKDVRKRVKGRFGVGIKTSKPNKLVKGSPEAKAKNFKMAKLRAMRKKGAQGGSFRL